MIPGELLPEPGEIELNAGLTRAVLTGDQMIAEMIHDVQVEATFPDGTKLVTVHEPIR